MTTSMTGQLESRQGTGNLPPYRTYTRKGSLPCSVQSPLLLRSQFLRYPVAPPLFARSLELRQGSPFHPFILDDGSSRRRLRAESRAPDTSRSLSTRFGGTPGSAGAVPADLCVSCAFQKPPRSLVFYGIAFRLLLIFYHPHPSMSLRA